jgi:hypothetical protein
LVNTQTLNFAPRIGFAYQAPDKLVARAGFGLFYNSFNNQGYGPNIGENYPFVYNFNYVQQNLAAPPRPSVWAPLGPVAQQQVLAEPRPSVQVYHALPLRLST